MLQQGYAQPLNYVPLSTSNDQESKRTRHVPDSIEHLEKTIVLLQQRCSELYDRLQPVSSQQEPKAELQQSTPATGVGLADRILAQARAIDSINISLGGILQRLEI